jgi:5-methyltetrahydropteroyltriglutamate--homocysteine methyltransferase
VGNIRKIAIPLSKASHPPAELAKLVTFSRREKMTGDIGGGVRMFRATKDIKLPTTITGSLPRPSWYTENLGTRHFLEAMVSRRFREQYEDAVTCYLRDQEIAGLDIVTDGDAHFDDDVGGQSWTAYPPNHMSGLDIDHPVATPAGRGGIWFPRGHILHDYLESRVMPVITGPIGRGNLQYTAMWKAAQRFTTKPVKFGAVSAEIVAFALQDRHYKSVPDRMFAIADAFNEEYHELADAGCPVIQIEEPQIHLIAVRKIQDKVINPQLMVEVFNRTVKGLRAKTEVWAHSCWGNPSQQRMFAAVQSYKPALETYNTVDADVITFESSASISKPSARLSPKRRSPSGSSTITRCRLKARTRSRRRSAPRSNSSRRSGW